MYRYGKWKYTLEHIQNCWKRRETTMLITGKFELFNEQSSLPIISYWDYIDEIEILDKSYWEFLSKRLKGKANGANMAGLL